METATTENDVAVAAIEADAEIQIAQIEADASVQREEAYSEARVAEAEAYSQGNDELWASINRLTSTVETLAEKIQTLTTLAPAPVSLSEITEEVAETVSETLTETDLTQTSISPPTSETQMVATEKSEDASPVIPPLLEVDRKPIIRLV